MTTIETIKPNLHQLFEGVDEARQTALALQNMTDRDFLDDAGHLDSSKKRANKKNITEAEKSYIKTVDVAMGRLAITNLIDDELERSVLFGSLGDRFSGFSKRDDYKFTPDDVETGLAYAANEVDKFKGVLDWWRNPSKLFASFRNATISLFPTDPHDRCILEGEYRQIYSGHYSPPSIFAAFKDGVSLDFKNDNNIDITSTKRGVELKVGLFGWDGWADKHWRPDDFKGDEQKNYLFLNDETVNDLGPTARFALRVAKNILEETTAIENLEIPAPDEEFALTYANHIARAVVREFLGRHNKIVRDPGSFHSSHTYNLKDIPTPISTASIPELKNWIKSAGVSNDLQAERLDHVINDLRGSGLVVPYIEAIKLEPLIERFKKDILSVD